MYYDSPSYSLPAANEVAGRQCFQSCVSVRLFTGRWGPYVTMTYDEVCTASKLVVGILLECYLVLTLSS